MGPGRLGCPSILGFWMNLVLLGKLDVMKGVGFQGIFAVCITVA